MTAKREMCTECEGDGEYTVQMDSGWLAYGTSPREKTVKCKTCDGTGHVRPDEGGEDD